MFCMQSRRDAERVLRLGIPEQKVTVVGNLKFDDLPSVQEFQLKDFGFKKNEMIWIAGSTHPGEEEIVLKIFKSLASQFGDLRLIIAPRHIERTNEVLNLVVKFGFHPLKFSEIYQKNRKDSEGDSVIVLDTIGQLKSLYSLSRIVFVGKSLSVGGGQNIIEPAFFGNAVVVGPLMQNFRDIMDVFLKDQAVLQVKDEKELEEKMKFLLEHPQERDRLGRSARKVIEKHRGATDQTLAVIAKVLADSCHCEEPAWQQAGGFWRRSNPFNSKKIASLPSVARNDTFREYFYRLMTDQDQSPMGWIVKWMLCGFSLFYRGGIQTILWFYKIGLLKKIRLSKPVISIGNITWGGTGKTPLVEWLLKYLKGKELKPAVLIRGYMVKNDGSDEAQALQQSFPDVPILVGRNRIENARRFLGKKPVDVFVLDDGFQHWKLHRDLEIVVIDCLNPFGNGCLIPRGILREPLNSLKRADLFVLTKTDWGRENISAIKKRLQSINPDAPIIETVHRAAALADLCDPSVQEPVEFLKGKKVAAFCGIGQPDSFLRLLKSLDADVVVFKAFGDHHAYDKKDVSALLDVCREKKVQIIVTTQKDAVKLTQFLRHSEQSPKGEVKNLIHEEILRFAQDDGKKNRLLSVKMEIQIIKGYEELCGRISRLLDR
ncbi:MAG TPA: tetraacyldisaccharide 4'-kinase [Candidatus Omnitrophota bacterium]|nr:tetraacyldisaccharide 4'-kinase [Candidatus Omnitrophota bacterium]